MLAWAAARDAALRGLVHALSNRAGTVAAVAGMLEGDAPAASVVTAARVLGGEGERLDALLAHLRLVSADPFGADAAPEPLHPAELAAEVAALAVAAGWEVTAAPAAAGDALPAFARRAGAAHVLLVLAHAAEAAAGAPVTVRCASDAGTPVIRVVPESDPHGGARVPALSPAARAACVWLVGPDAIGADPGVLRLPPLAPT